MFYQKTRLNEVLLFFISVFFFLVTAEITLRLTKSIPPFYKIDLFSFREYSLSSNPKLIYVPKPNSGEFNAYGHRGIAYPFFKKNDKKRILVIGDSVVEGLRVGVQDRFTEKLGNKLGSQYEVINLGVRGYNLLQEFEYFKLLGTKFSPDIVLWGITYNDLVLQSGEVGNLNKLIQKIERGHFYKEYYRAKSQIERTLLCSYLYKYIRYFLLLYSKKNFEEVAYYEITKKEARDLLEQMKYFSRKDNFKLVFIFLPVNTLEYADRMQDLEALVKSEGIASVNLNNHFNNMNKKELFRYADFCHLNQKGHQEVAEALYEKIF